MEMRVVNEQLEDFKEELDLFGAFSFVIGVLLILGITFKRHILLLIPLAIIATWLSKRRAISLYKQKQ